MRTMACRRIDEQNIFRAGAEFEEWTEPIKEHENENIKQHENLFASLKPFAYDERAKKKRKREEKKERSENDCRSILCRIFVPQAIWLTDFRSTCSRTHTHTHTHMFTHTTDTQHFGNFAISPSPNLCETVLGSRWCARHAIQIPCNKMPWKIEPLISFRIRNVNIWCYCVMFAAILTLDDIMEYCNVFHSTRAV